MFILKTLGTQAFPLTTALTLREGTLQSQSCVPLRNRVSLSERPRPSISSRTRVHSRAHDLTCTLTCMHSARNPLPTCLGWSPWPCRPARPQGLRTGARMARWGWGDGRKPLDILTRVRWGR